MLTKNIYGKGSFGLWTGTNQTMLVGPFSDPFLTLHKQELWKECFKRHFIFRFVTEKKINTPPPHQKINDNNTNSWILYPLKFFVAKQPSISNTTVIKRTIANNKHRAIKTWVIGQSGVGKTSLIYAILDRPFYDQEMANIG